MFFIFLSLFHSLKQPEWWHSLVLFQKNDKNTWGCFKKNVLYFSFIQRLKQTKQLSFLQEKLKFSTMATPFFVSMLRGFFTTLTWAVLLLLIN